MNPLRRSKYERNVSFYSVESIRSYQGPSDTFIGEISCFVTEADPGITPQNGPRVDTNTCVLGVQKSRYEAYLSSLKLMDRFTLDGSVFYTITKIIEKRPGGYPYRVVGVKK